MNLFSHVVVGRVGTTESHFSSNPIVIQIAVHPEGEEFLAAAWVGEDLIHWLGDIINGNRVKS